MFGLKVKYVGGEEERGREEGKGLSSTDKTLLVKGARISYSIWEVEGNLMFVCFYFSSFKISSHSIRFIY